MEHLVNFWPLLGVAVITVAFILRINPMLAIIAALLTSGFAAHLPFIKILELIGSGFLKTRNLTLLTLLPLAVVGLMERHGLRERAQAAGIPFTTTQVGGMFGLYFTDQEDITSFDSMLACDVEAFKKFFHGMLKRGVYLAPSAFEAGFISSMHSDQDIAETIQAAKETFAEMKG